LVQVQGGFRAVTPVVAGACGDPDALGMGGDGHGQLRSGQARQLYQGARAGALQSVFKLTQRI
jgi:hypothetical protein